MASQTFLILQKVAKALLIRVFGEKSVSGRRAFYISIKRHRPWVKFLQIAVKCFAGYSEAGLRANTQEFEDQDSNIVR
jgi:hypothetical protein